MCYSQPLHDLMWYDGIWDQPVSYIDVSNVDRTHTYDIYSVSNQTKTKKIHRGMKGPGTLGLNLRQGFILPAKILGTSVEVTPKLVRLSTTIASPLSEWFPFSFWWNVTQDSAPTSYKFGVITFVHGLKQWLLLGLLVSPWFFGALKHCSMGASGLYHCGIVGSRDAWRVVKKNHTTEGRPWSLTASLLMKRENIPFYEYKGHHHLSIRYHVRF